MAKAKPKGSITEVKRKDGGSYSPRRWRVSLSVGRDPETGKYAKRQRVVHGRKADAVRVRDEMRTELEREQGTGDPADMTFDVLASRFIQYSESQQLYSASRLKNLRWALRRLSPYVGDMLVRDITPRVIEETYAALRTAEDADFGALSGASLLAVHKMLKGVLDQAIAYGVIDESPLDRVHAPSCDSPERRALSAEEARKLLAAVAESEGELIDKIGGYRPSDSRVRVVGLANVGSLVAVRLALATGMRMGEVLALTWDSVDLETGHVHIRASLEASTHRTKKPKTAAGTRVICIDATTTAYLSRWRERQEACLALAHIEQTDATPVCCGSRGEYIYCETMGAWWPRFAAACGFEGLKFHELRHTQATLLLANGVDVKTVQHRLGHASAALTLGVYGHAIPDNDTAAADEIARVLSIGDE